MLCVLISLYRVVIAAEEFSTSNFVAVDKTGVYVTPDSAAILPSITNKSLMQLAQDSGVVVQRRKVALNELLGGAFSEVGACGTAVVVTPVNQIGTMMQPDLLSLTYKS